MKSAIELRQQVARITERQIAGRRGHVDAHNCRISRPASERVYILLDRAMREVNRYDA
jgi:hypothetical protein